MKFTSTTVTIAMSDGYRTVWLQDSLQKCEEPLVDRLVDCGDTEWFATQLLKNDFIMEKRANDILSNQRSTKKEKVAELLKAAYTKIRTSR